MFSSSGEKVEKQNRPSGKRLQNYIERSTHFQ